MPSRGRASSLLASCIAACTKLSSTVSPATLADPLMISGMRSMGRGGIDIACRGTLRSAADWRLPRKSNRRVIHHLEAGAAAEGGAEDGEAEPHLVGVANGEELFDLIDADQNLGLGALLGVADLGGESDRVAATAGQAGQQALGPLDAQLLESGDQVADFAVAAEIQGRILLIETEQAGIGGRLGSKGKPP